MSGNCNEVAVLLVVWWEGFQRGIGLIARDRERLEQTRREVESAGSEALVLPVDVADATQVDEAAERVEREFGPIDIWVNDAMATVVAPFLEIKPEEFKRATEVTYLGFVYCTVAALKRMKPRDRGVIVQVGSALSYRSIPLHSPYCGAKHAIVGFTDSIRSELIHDNSRVHLTVVHAPAMNTPQFSWCRTRLPRQLQPVPPSPRTTRVCDDAPRFPAGKCPPPPERRAKKKFPLSTATSPPMDTIANRPPRRLRRIAPITCSSLSRGNTAHTALSGAALRLPACKPGWASIAERLRSSPLELRDWRCMPGRDAGNELSFSSYHASARAPVRGSAAAASVGEA